MIEVTIETALGTVTVAVDPDRAPIAAANFLAYVDRGYFEGSSVYRIVALGNQGPDIAHKIEVIQWGWPRDKDSPLPFIAHEPTGQTGLRHKRGTISMARLAVGTAGPAFFVCMSDQPELDEGGRRHPDGHGFAAFGHVVDGFETFERIFARAEPQDVLQNPIPILRAWRV